MEIHELTDQQIASLTREEVTELEENPDKVDEILARQKKATPDDDKPKQEEQDGAANGAGKSEDEEEPVVLNKSGKGVIPYATVKGLRVENATLKEQLDSLQKAAAELESLKQQRADAKTPGKRSEIQEKLKAHIAVMNEDFPEVGNSLESVNELITDMSAELEAMRNEQQARAEADKAAKEKSVAEQVTEAKDNNPDLSHWEASDPEAWDEALKQDEILRTNAKWREKSYPERFVEVVRRVRAVMPEATQPNKPKSAEQTRADAKAKLENAPARQPTTLSDVPGGADPASERDKLENLSPLELVQRLTKMPHSTAAAMRADLD